MTTVDQLSTDCPTNNPTEGARRLIDGEERVFYDGYWIKTYPVPADTLEAKKRLIEGLTRRLFNHTEHGLNIPGTRLAEAKAAHESETDPARKRVKAAMLAGAYFNRATDIFRRLVELQADGIEISSDDALMRECGQCLLDAMALGRFVLHRSGEEGIDELWGEPFRAFSIPLEDFYESRYIKIGQTMRDIDKIANAMINNFSVIEPFSAIESPVRDFANAAKIKAENLRTDHDIFEVWSQLVTAAERLGNFTPRSQAIEKRQPDLFGHRISDGLLLIRQGRDLIFYLARARTPMPKSTRDYIERCEVYLNSGRLPFIPAPLPA
ncbi:hypothetical protein KI614_09095 [Dechloromonas denitrificans]|uniref:hypothetical protein n=1 Tax=Dechloromonas denitrificans TaxID=281362 RepID=UPI001CF82C87|nr:hypothetical protein [Dechloromonas denitrificans]UCV10369.1 hypothetical protein KI614_09095 [Dechloromonas denitrificans]